MPSKSGNISFFSIIALTTRRLIFSETRALEKNRVKREVSFSQLPSSSSSPANQLEIIGQGGRLSDVQTHHEMYEDEILDEVLVLLARLDRERLRLINFLRTRTAQSRTSERKHRSLAIKALTRSPISCTKRFGTSLS